ncbi:hypothetical protein ACT7DF_31825 [Bacillus cereus]
MDSFYGNSSCCWYKSCYGENQNGDIVIIDGLDGEVIVNHQKKLLPFVWKKEARI